MKCLLVVDSYSWALHNRAVNLKRTIKDISFDILYFKDCKNNFNKYDIIYLLNWPIYEYVKDKISPNRKYRFITSVSSHIGRRDASKMKTFFSKFDAVSCSNMFLYKEFLNAKLNSKIYYTPFGVNTDIFYKKNNLPDPVVFGWCGNSKRKVKRFDYIKKACKQNNVKLITADAGSGYSRDQMCDFYNKISCLICFSESEGTPNPVLESLACGRPVISSNVGNVPEIYAEFGIIDVVKTYSDLIKSIKLFKLKEIDNSNFRLKWSWNNKHKNFINFIKGDICQ